MSEFFQSVLVPGSRYATYALVVVVFLCFAVAYCAPFLIEQIYRWWPFGRIRALREIIRAGDKWPYGEIVVASHREARHALILRQYEAINALVHDEVSAKIYKFLAAAADFAQGILAVIMLTIYVRERVTPRTVAIWGIVILGASLFKRVYSPDVRAKEATEKSENLDALIRSIQTQLSSLDIKSTRGEDRTDALVALQYQLAGRLTLILNPSSSGTIPPLPLSPDQEAQRNQPPSVSQPPPINASTADNTERADTRVGPEDPRLLVFVEPLKKEGFQNTVGIVLKNVGGSEAHEVRIANIAMIKTTIEFPANIGAIAKGESSHPIAPRIREAGALQMYDLPTAIFGQWDYQPTRMADLIPVPAVATYLDFQGRKFKASWIFEFHPFKYHAWLSRKRKHTDEWLPDVIGPYLTISKVTTERVIE
jgi:hypothetical protein